MWRWSKLTWGHIVTYNGGVDTEQVFKAPDACGSYQIGGTTVKSEQHDQQESNLPSELAAPARRALTGAGIRRLERLTEMSEADVKQLHGIGPNAIRQLRRALDADGLSFADEKRRG